MTAQQESLLHTEGLSAGYDTKTILKDINLEVEKGEFICLIGANGTGKSTLLRTLAGLLDPLKGDVYVENRKIRDYRARQLAKTLSLVLTENTQTGNLMVRELVGLGRLPYTNWHGSLTSEDSKFIEEAISKTGIEHLAERKVNTLSDGEAQKAMIARGLAQNTSLMLLDEPTIHLDLPNRITIISLLKQISGEMDKTFVMALHEMELSLQVADRLWLIDRQNQLHEGIPEDLALKGLLQENFTNDYVDFDHNTGTFRMKQSFHSTIKMSGNSHAACWTERALMRKGFRVTSSNEDASLPEISVSEAPLLWKIHMPDGGRLETRNIEELLKNLKGRF